MDINVYLFIVIALMLLIIMYLLFVLRRVRTQLRGYKGREFEPTYFSRRKRYDKNNLL